MEKILDIKSDKYRFTPYLGWSVSRYDTFNMCKRKYFYQYYAKFDKEFSRQKIDSLKIMTSIALEIGNTVHQTVETILTRLTKSTKQIDEKKLKDYIVSIIKEYSKKTFQENYYKTSVVDFNEIYKTAKDSIYNFLNSNRYKSVIEDATDNNTQFIIEPGGYGETRLGDLKIYAKVDFLIKKKDSLAIIDWKTGKENTQKYKKQMLAYAVWANDFLNVPIENISLYISYLKGTYSEVQIPTDGYDKLHQIIFSETQEMQNYCLDVENNIPQNKEHFPMCESIKLCGYCNFRELCNRN